MPWTHRTTDLEQRRRNGRLGGLTAARNRRERNQARQFEPGDYERALPGQWLASVRIVTRWRGTHIDLIQGARRNRVRLRVLGHGGPVTTKTVVRNLINDWLQAL